jgi:tetratricopeptide (TPR) repeat protein
MKTHSEASESVGYLLFESKQYADAIHHLNEALVFPETDERKRQLCFYLGWRHLDTGNLEAAEQKLIESLPPNCEDPSWTEVQFHLGRVYFQQGAYLKAKESFERCEFFMRPADTELKQKVSEWLAATRARLPMESRRRQDAN